MYTYMYFHPSQPLEIATTSVRTRMKREEFDQSRVMAAILPMLPNQQRRRSHLVSGSAGGMMDRMGSIESQITDGEFRR